MVLLIRYSETKCMLVGRSPFTPQFHINGVNIDVEDELTILGVTFSNNLSSGSHVSSRTSACRRAMFSLAEAVSTYPGLNTAAKRHIWKSMGLPALVYGLESSPLSKKDTDNIESCQSSLIKSCLHGTREKIPSCTHNCWQQWTSPL